MENMIFFSILSHILFYPVLCLKIFVAHIALEGWSRLKMQIKKFILPFLSYLFQDIDREGEQDT